MCSFNLTYNNLQVQKCLYFLIYKKVTKTVKHVQYKIDQFEWNNYVESFYKKKEYLSEYLMEYLMEK